ncbi:MAG: winged helix-turn-helix domain-containing protein [Paracoccaceae bacterium]
MTGVLSPSVGTEHNDNAPKVLVVKARSAQRRVLIQNLAGEGFEVLTADAGDRALLLAVEAAPDIIVLDWSMPVMSGVDVCRHLKAHPVLRRIPIILLAKLGKRTDGADVGETGADDIIEKPYSVVELMARLRLQLLRARPTTEGETLEFEDLVFDGERYQVFRAGRPVHLGPTEFRLLATLIERPGKVWTREQLLDRIWDQGAVIEARTVDVHIARLRRALGQKNSGHPVRTVRGVGYALG